MDMPSHMLCYSCHTPGGCHRYVHEHIYQVFETVRRPAGNDKILSDNGKNFKAAAVFLGKVFKDQSVIDHLANLGTEWLFNAEKAPWWGSVFERLVKSTKHLRKFITGQIAHTVVHVSHPHYQGGEVAPTRQEQCIL